MGYKVVGVTACIMGVAHTYLSAEALEKCCKKDRRIDSIHVETQGSMGIENRLKQKDVEEADFVVLTNEIKIGNRERFTDKIIVEVNGSTLIKKTQEIIDKAIAMVEERNSKQ